MRIIDINEANANFSTLIDSAQKGEPFVIAENGKPLVVVTAYTELEPLLPKRRIGFMEGVFIVPDDFDSLGKSKIEVLFQANNSKHKI